MTLPDDLPIIDEPDPDFPFADVMLHYPPVIYYDLLCNRIVGQDEAKRAASMIVYNTLNIRSCTALFAGQSGSGKTEIWRVLSGILPDFIHIIDASQITPPGYRGVSLASLLYDIEKSTNGKPSIIVLDEVDKLLCSYGEFGQEKAAQLLKLLEHSNFELQTDAGDRRTFTFHGVNASVVLLGAFTDLRKAKLKPQVSLGFGSAAPETLPDKLTEDDLIAAGIFPEIVGRIERIVTMEPPDSNIYRQVAELAATELTKTLDRTVTISDTTLQRIVAEAERRDLGARYVKNRIYNELDNALFACPTSSAYVL